MLLVASVLVGFGCMRLDPTAHPARRFGACNCIALHRPGTRPRASFIAHVEFGVIPEDWGGPSLVGGPSGRSARHKRRTR
jgi:hypothetical protein